MKDILMRDIPLNYGKFPDPQEHRRKWWVFSQQSEARWLLLFCARTGARGAVKDPSASEWDLYSESWEWAEPWGDPCRVTLIEEGRDEIR